MFAARFRRGAIADTWRNGMSFRLLNPLGVPDWNVRFVTPGSDSFFLTREWASVIHDSYGYTPCYLVADTYEAVPMLMPLMDVHSWLTGCRGVSLPFSDFCEPIGLVPARADALLAAVGDLGAQRGWRYCEFRSASGFAAETPVFARYWRHNLDLASGEYVLFSRLSGSVRTAIRKAAKAGVTVSFGHSRGALCEFYKLHALTRRGHGLPAQPFRFFASLHRHVLSAGLGVVALAHYEGRAIAASVFAFHGRQALYKYGASDKHYQKLRAANLIMWEAIRRFVGQGYAQLAMGRTAFAHDGLRRFKLGWGTAEAEVGYRRYDLRSRQFQTLAGTDRAAGYAFIRVLPVSLARIAGAILYRHVG